MWSHLVRALNSVFVFVLLCCLAYPLGVTGLSRFLFQEQSSGRLVELKKRVVGSLHIGQLFHSKKYFHGRPSHAGVAGYDGGISGASNYDPMSSLLSLVVKARIAKNRDDNPSWPESHPVPADLVYASGSGLDPDISLEAALYQVPRVASHRGKSIEEISVLVNEKSFIPGFGQMHRLVNVLQLNLALDL